MTPAKRGRDALDEGKKSTQRGREGSEDEDEDEVCRKRSRSEVLIVALECTVSSISPATAKTERFQNERLESKPPSSVTGSLPSSSSSISVSSSSKLLETTTKSSPAVSSHMKRSLQLDAMIYSSKRSRASIYTSDHSDVGSYPHKRTGSLEVKSSGFDLSYERYLPNKEAESSTQSPNIIVETGSSTSNTDASSNKLFETSTKSPSLSSPMKRSLELDVALHPSKRSKASIYTSDHTDVKGSWTGKRTDSFEVKSSGFNLLHKRYLASKEEEPSTPDILVEPVSSSSDMDSESDDETDDSNHETGVEDTTSEEDAEGEDDEMWQAQQWWGDIELVLKKTNRGTSPSLKRPRSLEETIMGRFIVEKAVRMATLIACS